MTSTALRVVPPLPRFGRARHLIERNALQYRAGWLYVVSGFFEPLFYLLSIGVGVAVLVGDVTTDDGRVVPYTVFIAPAMLAASAMNGAIFDATYNVFFKLKFAKTYDAILATPMAPRDIAVGEVTWALLRGGLYSAMFMTVMLVLGLMRSWWALLLLPGALVVGFTFAAAAMAATTYMRSWQDFEYVALTTMPMFLFSATFYPLSTYPEALQWVVEATPLYHGVALLRGLATGGVGMGMVWHLAYLAALGAAGLWLTSRRLERLLLT